MLKKLSIILLILSFAMAAFAGPKPEAPATMEEKPAGQAAMMESKYKEAPMLAERVARGELEPLEERLPENPMVVKPFDEIGTYGGTLNSTLWRQPSDGPPVEFNHASLTYIDYSDMVTVTPGLVESWEFSNSFKTLTFFFRKGLKWSDGVPFTVDDVIFYYEDMLMNKEVTPAVPSRWEGSSVKRIDDSTMSFTFADPFPHFFRPYGIRNNGIQEGFFLPKHYAEQFHPKYNANAQAEAKAAGFDQWYQYLKSKAIMGEHQQTNPECPTMAPWRIKESTPEYILFERNPYFWAVDTAGNQLPYIDNLMGVFALNQELRQAKALAGELDFVDTRDLTLQIYPELKSKEKELGLKVWTATSLWGNFFTLMPNQTASDPKKRGLFQNLKFRQALSLSIDREEISEILFSGLAKPQQVVPVPNSGFWYPELANYMIELDPAKANQLLDEIGLNKINSRGFRTWPDGSDLKLKLDLGENVAGWTDAAELVARHVRENAKLDMTANIITYEALKENNTKGISDIPCWAHAGGVSIDMFNGIHSLLLGWMYGSAWMTWMDTNGMDGEEPPDWLKEVKQLSDQWSQMSAEEGLPLIKKAHEILTKQLACIGTVAQTPVVMAVSDRLGNIFMDAPLGASDYGGPLIMLPFQWYFKD